MNTPSRSVVPAVLITLAIAGGAIVFMSRTTTPQTPPPPALATELPPDRIEIKDTIIRPGDVITSEGLPNSYYVGLDNKRYVFTTAEAYNTWYPKASPVKLLERKKLESVPLGGNATYRPGMRVITLDTDTSYYVVAHGGVLRKVSESLLRTYYGSAWRERLDNLPEYYRADYRLGEPVYRVHDYSPVEEYRRSPTMSTDKGIEMNLPAKK